MMRTIPPVPEPTQYPYDELLHEYIPADQQDALVPKRCRVKLRKYVFQLASAVWVPRVALYPSGFVALLDKDEWGEAIRLSLLALPPAGTVSTSQVRVCVQLPAHEWLQVCFSLGTCYTPTILWVDEEGKIW